MLFILTCNWLSILNEYVLKFSQFLISNVVNINRFSPYKLKRPWDQNAQEWCMFSLNFLPILFVCAGSCCVRNEWLSLYQKLQIHGHRSGLFRALCYPLWIDSFPFSYECIWLFNLRLPLAIFSLYSHCHQPSQSPYQFISCNFSTPVFSNRSFSNLSVEWNPQGWWLNFINIDPKNGQL